MKSFFPQCLICFPVIRSDRTYSSNRLAYHRVIYPIPLQLLAYTDSFFGKRSGPVLKFSVSACVVCRHCVLFGFCALCFVLSPHLSLKYALRTPKKKDDKQTERDGG